MALHYELVIFTAADQQYADMVLEEIDPQKIISHRLYRQHMTVRQTVGMLGAVKHRVKNLVLVGRPMESIIIVDN
jgi:CTD small phosphatase-like protein 2